MKTITKQVIKLPKKLYASVFLLLVLATACNKDFKNTLQTTYNDNTGGIQDNPKKVLYIILDGVNGSVVKSLAPQNITKISKKAIFSYDGLSDPNKNAVTNAAGWANMTTGVDYKTHGVSTEDFANFNSAKAPSLFSRIKNFKPTARTVSFASTAAFNTHLASDATELKTLADDAAVKKATIDELNAKDPTLVLAQFHSAELTGAANGYTAANTAYTSAINTLDTYIGEILNALTARKTFDKENWLVIVASNKGGVADPNKTIGENVFEDESRNTLTIFYNPKFAPKEFKKPDFNSFPYVGIAAKYDQLNGAQQRDPNFLNLGTDKEATIRFNLRWDNGVKTFPQFVSKRRTFDARVTGWLFFMDNGGNIGFNLSSTKIGYNIQTIGNNVSDGLWHSVAVKFWNDGAARRVTLFTDGVAAPNLNITVIGNLDTDFPLTFGLVDQVNCFITEFAVYDVAIPDNDIKASSKSTPITPTNDPYYNNLTGYWHGNEGTGYKLKDITGKAADFDIVGSANWISFSDVSPNISPAITQDAFRTVPNGVDIPVLIYNWIDVLVPNEWGLTGKLFVPSIKFSTN